MVRKIVFTFSSKLFTTAANFLIILLTARYLGAEGRGLISLLVLGITINLLVSNIFGGAAISYLAPRIEIFRLVVPAYTWAVISTLLVTVALVMISLVPAYLGLHLLFLSLLQALYTIHLNVLLGKGLVRNHNLVNALQVAVLFMMLLFELFIVKERTIFSYLVSFYGSLGFSLLLTMFFLRDEIRFFPVREWWMEWKLIVRNGYIIQIASIAQLLNYRFSYYILDHYCSLPDDGKKMVGIYATAVAIGEALWIIGRSMGLIQYTSILKETDTDASRTLTVKYGKISFLLTLLLMIPLLIMPPAFYQFVFGNEFGDLTNLLYLLMPGILSFAIALMYSNYFAGIGMNTVNLIGSLCGLVITILAGILIVPALGMKGAAITASFSFIGTSVYLCYRFVAHSNIPWLQLLPGLHDVKLLKVFLKKKMAG